MCGTAERGRVGGARNADGRARAMARARVWCLSFVCRRETGHARQGILSREWHRAD